MDIIFDREKQRKISIKSGEEYLHLMKSTATQEEQKLYTNI